MKRPTIQIYSERVCATHNLRNKSDANHEFELADKTKLIIFAGVCVCAVFGIVFNQSACIFEYN